MRVKICGVTRAADAALAVHLGATDIGCVLVPRTPRHVGIPGARRVFARLPEHVHRVLVFRAATVEEVVRAADAAEARDVQLHRTSESVAAELERRGLRVRRVVEAPPAVHELRRATAQGPAVIDVAGGGSGVRFDWSALRGLPLGDVFVAGGITPRNVRGLVALQPHGIDLSSGVERAPGLKDPELLRRLFEVLLFCELQATGRWSS